MSEYIIPNLNKACQVLEFISNNPNGYTLKEIVAQLDIPRTTALRITSTLQQADYLARKDDGALVLGSAVVQLGVKALDCIDIRGYSRPVLHQLTGDTGESTHLAMLNGTQSMLVEVCDSPHPLRIAARPGTLVDLHCSATGKIFLAYCISDPAAFCQKLTLNAHTPRTHITIEQIMAGIEETRKNGYAIDEEEYAPGVRCIGAPVTNAFGKVNAAIGLTASSASFTPGKTAAMAEKIKAAASEISRKLGHAG